MGNTIWLQVADGKSPDGGERDNSMMLRLGSQLDALAKRIGVDAPSSFHDSAGLGELIGLRLKGAWFDSQRGHASLAALLSELRARPESLGFTPQPSQSHWPRMLMDELEYCVGILSEAVAHGRKFRLRIVS